MDSTGNLYGTTGAGGANGNGAVFKLTPSGAETILHFFAGTADGANPGASLLMDEAGNIYGTTRDGGVHCTGPDVYCGWYVTVFEIQ